MNRKETLLAACALVLSLTVTAQDRTPHASMWLTATASDGTVLMFNYDDDGTEYVVEWGMDTAWDSEANVLMGTNHIGSDRITTGRISFQPNDTVDSDGNLSNQQQVNLLSRINHIKESGTTAVTLNCDHEVLNSDDFYGKPEAWYKVIKASVAYAQAKGLTVTTIAPFNEPDYVYWGEGDEDDFLAICQLIAADEDLAGIRISAGNTLNCDNASYWYNYMKPYVTEGNTHQLAGSFDSYAAFFAEVVADGNHATADELHNVGEAIVGVEYGMQTGIWWAFDGVARGDFCIANTTGGARLGYAEDRDSWTAASVYRLPATTAGSAEADGKKVEAFIGSSERQATDHTYQFVALDRPVYYDGYGPVHSYGQDMPGGTAYQTGQTNAERMIRISGGEDVPPFFIDTDTFVIMNKNSKFVMSIKAGSTENGSSIVQGTYSGTSPQAYQQWIVSQVDERIGGDFGYYSIESLRTPGRYFDVLNWSTSAGGGIIAYDGELGTNEQWCLEYAGDGDYYIRNHYSGLYLGVSAASTKNNAAVVQQELTGEDHQRWRFLSVNSARDLDAPAAPTGLQATAQNASVLLSWDENTEDSDVMGYTVLRAEQTDEGEPAWQVIGRNVSGTEFVDNSCSPAQTYLYKVRAMDLACNSSEASDSILAQVSGEKGLVAKWQFDGTLLDESANLFDAALYGDASYSSSICKSGDYSLTLDGSENFVQLPASVGDLSELTICAWVYLRDRSTSWQRIFDFGNGTDQYMFLTPYSGSDMRLVLKNGGDEQVLSATKLGATWRHVAATLDADSVRLYVDGELVASTADITIRPSDFKPVLNYIGRSQYAADPLLKANIDDFRVYNQALSASEIAAVMTDLASGIVDVATEGSASPVVATEYYSLSGSRLSQPQPGIYIQRDRHADGSTTVTKRMK